MIDKLAIDERVDQNQLNESKDTPQVGTSEEALSSISRTSSEPPEVASDAFIAKTLSESNAYSCPVPSSNSDASNSVEESDVDLEIVVDGYYEDGYEDDDEEEDDDDDDVEDDDEEGGVEADDEDDFAESEVVDRTPGLGDTLNADDLPKLSSVYPSSDSSDDSMQITKKKTSVSGRLCDNMRRRKLNKVKECSLPRPNIPDQVDQTAMLSEAMTNLKLDSGRLQNICDANTISNNTERIVGSKVYLNETAEVQVSEDPEENATVEAESGSPHGQQISKRVVKSDGAVSTEEENSSLNEEDIKELMRQEALQRRRETCTCEACESKRCVFCNSYFMM